MRLISSLIVSAAISTAALGQASETVTFQAADGVTVFAEVYLAEDGKRAPLILLFHQGGSNGRGEYHDYIAPRLVDAGFNAIAPDARVGGDIYGGSNRTADGLTEDKAPTTYGDAYPDLEATLEFAIREGFTGPRFAWGSSYSATLVLKLAEDHPGELEGVLSFSPASGSNMGAWQPDDYVAGVRAPAFVAWPPDEMERPGRAEIRRLMDDNGFETHVAPEGVHGSSMLHPDRAPGGTEELWDEVVRFLQANSNS